MGVVAKPRCAVVFLMVLTLGVSLVLPAEDVLDAVYDESETLPFEFVSLFSIATLPVAARITPVPLSSLQLKLVAPSPFTPAHVRNTDAHRSADQRALSALLCILLC